MLKISTLLFFFLCKLPDKTVFQFTFASDNNGDLFLKKAFALRTTIWRFLSYGLSESCEAPIQAETFTIEDNRLYLNCNLKLQEMEYKEQAARIAKAIFNLEKIQKKIGFFSSKVN